MKVHIITWDGVEYDRESNLHEIESYKNTDYVIRDEKGITFDFRDKEIKNIKEKSLSFNDSLNDNSQITDIVNEIRNLIKI